MAIQFTRFTLLIASLFSLSAQIAFVQATTTTSSAPATTSTGPATIYPGTSQWAYYGCYNETTLTNGTNGLRALNGGVNEALDSMTVDVCLAFCESNMYSFAGLEYTRYVSHSFSLHTRLISRGLAIGNFPSRPSLSQYLIDLWTMTNG